MGIELSFGDGDTPMDIVDRVSLPSFRKLHELIEDIIKTTPTKTNKNKCVRLTPGAFIEGEGRKLENLESIQILGVDVDNLKNIDLLFDDLELLEEKGIAYIMYGTPSHTAEKPRYRVFFLLDIPCLDYKEYKASYKATVLSVLPNATFSKDHDPKTKYIIDSAPSHAAAFFYISQEHLLDTLHIGDGDKAIKLAEVSVNEVVKKKDQETEAANSIIAAKLENTENVLINLESIIKYLKRKELSITSDYVSWLAICYACVSLQYNGLTEEECFEYFSKFSEMDKETEVFTGEEAILKQFDDCWKGASGDVSIGTIYHRAQQVGWNFERPLNETPHLIVGRNNKEFHLVMHHEENAPVVSVDRRPLDWDWAKSEVKNSWQGKYSLTKKHIGWFNEKGKYMEYKRGDFLTLNTTIHPENYAFMLGAEQRGTYYDTVNDILFEAKHHRRPATPVYSKPIADWLKQLDIPYEWICSYLYFVTQLDRALPGIILYGETGSGKTLFCELLGSIYSEKPDKKFFSEDGFHNTAGVSPFIWLEEAINITAAKLKEIITSDKTAVNKKNDGRALFLKGFHRILMSVNQTILSLPQDDKTDQRAMERRIQQIKTTAENAQYLRDIGGISTTKRWVGSDFKNHVKYIQENPKEFGILEPEDDIIILKPLGFNSLEDKIFGGKALNRRVIEYVVSTMYGSSTVGSRGGKYCHILIKDTIEKLKVSGHTRYTLSDNDLREILLPIFHNKKGKLPRSTDGQGIHCFKITKEQLMEAVRILKLNIDEGEE